MQIRYLHEEVRRPHAVEEVAGALLLDAVVLAQVEELEHVRVPGLNVPIYAEESVSVPPMQSRAYQTIGEIEPNSLVVRLRRCGG